MVGPSNFTGIFSQLTKRNDIPLPDSDIEKVKSCFMEPISDLQARAYVSSIRRGQINRVLHELARKYPKIVLEWQKQDTEKQGRFIWEKLPEDLKPHILGPDFSKDEFVRRLLITRSLTDPGIVYRLTDEWQNWALHENLHPMSPRFFETVGAELCDSCDIENSEAREARKPITTATISKKRGRKAAKDGGPVKDEDFKRKVVRLIEEGCGDAEIARLMNEEKEDYDPEITAPKIRTVRRWSTNNPDYFVQKFGKKGGKKKK